MQMHETLSQNPMSEALEVGKAPFQVIRRIREAILEGTFKPGDRLLEADLGERFKVSRSPVREALLALENEGTAIVIPYKGAIVKPLSPEEVLDIGELRLATIALVAKPVHHRLSPADFELLYGLAKQITAANSAREHFEYDRRFWDILFEKARRPILWEIFTGLDHRMTRYYPLYQKLFPTPQSRPRQREVLIELYRNGKIAEAVGAFSKLYLEVVDQFIDHLNTRDGSSSPR
jgi:DNA-binding GntR family transcriptional regulator